MPAQDAYMSFTQGNAYHHKDHAYNHGSYLLDEILGTVKPRFLHPTRYHLLFFLPRIVTSEVVPNTINNNGERAASRREQGRCESRGRRRYRRHCACGCAKEISVEGVDVPLGVVSQALSPGRKEAFEENGRLPPDFLLLHVYVDPCSAECANTKDQ